jgi:hypothetical protein
MKRILLVFGLLFLCRYSARAQTEVASGEPATCDPNRGLLSLSTTTQKMKTCTAINRTALSTPGAKITSGLFVNRPATCNSGDIYVDSNTYKCFPVNTGNAFGGGPDGNNLDAQCNQSFNKCAGPTVNHQKGDQIFYGPNPWYDARQIGLRAATGGVVPAVPGITANCNGNTTLNLSSPSTFQNGDGIIVFGCGIGNPISTPAAPTVTPSTPASESGIALDVNSQTGGTTYDYCVAAWNYGNNTATDPGTSVTACSPVGTTTVGLAALGPQTVAISSITASNNIFSYVTSGPQTMGVGSSFVVSGAVPATFNGFYLVGSWTDSTHFSAIQLQDTRNDAPTTATNPGTLEWITSNRISLAAAATGSVDNTKYIVYRSGPGGGGVIACVMWPQLASMVGDKSYLACDDYGMTYSPTPSLPYYVPTTAPSTATNEGLSTTILSGGGTTTLTVADAAANSSTGQTILLDEGIILEKAAVAAKAANARVYIPPGPGAASAYVVNAPVQLPTFSEIEYSGGMLLNDTISSDHLTWNGYFVPAGSSLSFAWNPLTKVSIGRAWPGFISNGPIYIYRTELDLADAQVGIIDGGSGGGGIPSSNFDHVAFSLSGNGYTSIGYVTQGNKINGGSIDVRWKEVNFGASQLGFGKMYTPAAFVNNGGNFDFYHCFLSGKGIMFRTPSAGGYVYAHRTYSQGNYMPFFGFVNVDGGTTNYMYADFPTFDTTSAPLATNFGAVTLVVTAVAPLTSGGAGVVSGTGNVTLNMININGTPGTSNGYEATSNPVLYTTDGLWGIAGNNVAQMSLKTVYSHLGLGPGNTLFIRGYTPPAPTCPVSAGGGTAIGTNTYLYSPIWETGSEGTLSNVCTAVTTAGSQTVTVSWPTIVGAKAYMTYRNGIRWQCAPITTSTIVDTGGGSCGNSIPNAPLDGPIGAQNGLLHTQKLAVGRTTFTKVGDTAEQAVSIPDNSGTMTLTIGSGTTTTPTATVNTGTCGSATNVTVIGMASTDNLWLDFNADPTGTTGFTPGSMLTIIKYAGSGQFSYKLCNNTAGNITPGAVTLNYRVTR